MRPLRLIVTTAAALALAGCSSTEMPDNGFPTTGAAPDPTTTITPPRAPVDQPPAAFDAVESTLADAEKFAVELEQVFFRTGYPTDLAGARAAAEKTGLKLAEGNAIASYVYDPDVREFRLCVENTSGAHATYDTRPMAMRDSGPTGGCP